VVAPGAVVAVPSTTEDAARAWSLVQARLRDPAPPTDLVRLAREREGLPPEPAAEAALAAALAAHLRRLAAVLGADDHSPPTDDREALEQRDGMLLWDALFCDYLAESFGAVGAAAAEDLREEARSRWTRLTTAASPEAVPIEQGRAWERWLPVETEDGTAPNDHCPALLALARVLVVAGQARPRLPVKRNAIFPAIARRTRDQLAMWRHGVQTRDREDGGLDLLSRTGATVAVFPALELTHLARLRAGVEAGQGLLLERVIRRLVRDAHGQAVKGINPFNRLVYRGGWSGFAQAAGITKGTDQAALHALLEALRHYRGSRRDLPPALDYWYCRGWGAHGRSETGELRVDLGEALWPGYVGRTPRGPGRHLLPTFDLPALNFTSPRLYLPLAQLQWCLLMELRERVRELADLGGVHLDTGTVHRLADKAEIRTEIALEALRVWSDLDRTDSWLHRTSEDRYTLRDPQARALLLDAADLAEARADHARLAVARKRRRPRKPARRRDA
jgi:hypothetical protein